MFKSMRAAEVVVESRVTKRKEEASDVLELKSAQKRANEIFFWQ